MNLFAQSAVDIIIVTDSNIITPNRADSRIVLSRQEYQIEQRH